MREPNAMQQQTPTTVELWCPLHGKALTRVEEGWACPVDRVIYPVVDGIPVLLPDAAARDHVAATDWSRPVQSSALDFYNRTQDQDRYHDRHLCEERKDIERWLPAAEQAHGAVLELGSGNGYLQGVGGDYVATDYSFTALRRFVSADYLRVCCTAEKLPFPSGSFRFIFSLAVLEHVPAAAAAFDEIDRVLASGGVAYIHPAWHCTQYNCEGIAVRPFSDLTVRQKMIKLTLPIRQNRLVKAAVTLPGRMLRRATWSLQRGPTRFRFRRLRPDYQTFWNSDSDAASRLDSHEGCLYFHSRGYEVLSPGRGVLRQVLAGHVPLVVRKPGRP